MGRLIKTRLKSYSIDMTEEEYKNVLDFLSSMRCKKMKAKKKAPSQRPQQCDLSADQKAALSVMNSGENVFLTGGAGTGKTFLLDRFLSSKKNAVRVAPTGKAAIKCGGMTIHKFFRVPIGILRPSELPEIGDDRKEAEARLFSLMKKRGGNILKNVSVIAIDEVSMCRCDLFEYVMRIIRLAEFAFKKHIQVILCGDFYQLPPIVPENKKNNTEKGKQEWEVWKQDFADNLGGWAFLSPSWKDANIQRVELHEVIRQRDAAFAEALNKIRVGDKSGLNWILSHSPKQITSAEYISIVSTNKAAATRNKEKLDAIRGKAKKYKIDVPQALNNGHENKAERKDWESTCEAELELKKGARVVALVNDTATDKETGAPRGSFVNGSVGTVTELKEDTVCVLFDGDDEPIQISAHKWILNGYEIGTKTDEDGNTYDEIKQIEIGEFSQIPLRLAWATTVHKSQGETYESAVNVICAPRFFAPGQAYVALSRATSIEQMHLTGYPYLLVSDAVKEYYKNDADEPMDENKARDIVDKLILEDFPTGIFSSEDMPPYDEKEEPKIEESDEKILTELDEIEPPKPKKTAPTKSKKKPKFYAVKVGKNPGIYTTWPTCLHQVNHYPNAVFKSFSTEEEARAWLGD